MEPLHYLAQWQVLICREHRRGILPTGLKLHLDQWHRHMPPDERRAVLDHVRRSGLVLAEPKQVPLPTAGSRAIPELSIHPGYHCAIEGCSGGKDSVSSSHDLVWRHRNREHRSHRHEAPTVGIDSVSLQCFFPDVRHRRWFIVRPLAGQAPSASASANDCSTSATTCTSLQSQLEGSFDRTLKEQADSFQQVPSLGSHVEHTPWLRRTGFWNHLRGLDKVVVQALAQDQPFQHHQLARGAGHPQPPPPPPPQCPDDRLAFLEQEVIPLLSRASLALVQRLNGQVDVNGDGCRISHLGARILNSFEAGRTQSRPFQTVSTASTLTRYGKEWARAVCYASRQLLLLQLQRRRREEQGGPSAGQQQWPQRRRGVSIDPETDDEDPETDDDDPETDDDDDPETDDDKPPVPQAILLDLSQPTGQQRRAFQELYATARQMLSPCERSSSEEDGHDAEEEEEPRDGQWHGHDEMADEETMGRRARAHWRRLLDHVLTLSITLVQQPLGQSSFQSPLVSFAAARSLSAQGHWLDPADYTSRLSALVYCAQLIIFGAYLRGEEQPRQPPLLQGMDPDEDGPPHERRGGEEDGEGSTASIEMDGGWRRLQLLCRRWLVNDRDTPVAVLNSIRLYGLAIGRQTLPASWTSWSEDGETVLYRDRRISMAQWRSLVRGLLEQARGELAQQLLFGLEDCPRLEARLLQDVIPEARPGYSFVQDPRNKLGTMERWLFRRVSRTPSLLGRFCRLDTARRGEETSGDPQWVPGSMQRYLRRVEAFLERLLVLIHLTAGLPARGPEILSTQYRNGERPRNVLIHHGRALILLYYHKQQHRVGQQRAVARFLAPAVGDLLVSFLVVVRPFADWLRAQLASSSTGGGPAAEAESTTAGEGRRGRWRRSRRTSATPHSSPSLSGPSSSSSPPPTQLFSSDGGRTSWTSQTLSLLLDEQARAQVGISLNVSSWRHLAIAIDRRHLQGLGRQLGLTARGPARGGGDGGEDGDDDAGDDDDHEHDGEGSLEVGDPSQLVHHWQASHSAHVGNTRYANQVEFGGHLTDNRLHQFRSLSERWWHLCGVLETTSTSSTSCRSSGATPVASSSGQAPATPRRRRQWDAREVEVGLRTLFGPSARARSREQWQALLDVARGTPQLLVVLPTGAGKSVLFQLPSLLPGCGTTVVVLPLVALRQDLARRCRELGVSFTDWARLQQEQGGRGVGGLAIADLSALVTTPLVLVGVEQAAELAFRTFVHRLELEGRLDRVVLDEAHLVLTAANYRPSLGLLKALRELRCPFVALSATLPPSMEAQLGERLLLPHPCVIRASVDRAKLSYGVRWQPRPSAREKALPFLSGWAGRTVRQSLDALEQEQQELPAADGDGDGMGTQRGLWRAIVYVPTVKWAEELAALLECEPYHGRLAEPERDRVFGSWVDGRRRVVVGTSAFGAGVDHPHVRLVVHVGAPESAIEYAQQSGRAGRDGDAASCLVLLPAGGVATRRGEASSSMSSSSSPPDALEMDRDTMRRFLQAPTPAAAAAAGARRRGQQAAPGQVVDEEGPCRRQILTAYLDGGDGQRCPRPAEGASACDLCRERPGSGEEPGPCRPSSSTVIVGRAPVVAPVVAPAPGPSLKRPRPRVSEDGPPPQGTIPELGDDRSSSFPRGAGQATNPPVLPPAKVVRLDRGRIHGRSTSPASSVGGIEVGADLLRQARMTQAQAREQYRGFLERHQGSCMLCLASRLDPDPPDPAPEQEPNSGSDSSLSRSDEESSDEDDGSEGSSATGGGSAAYQHPLTSCPRRRVVAQYYGFRQGLRLDRFTGCFRCANPEWVCANRGRGRCRYEDLVKPLCFVLLVQAPALVGGLGGPVAPADQGHGRQQRLGEGSASPALTQWLGRQCEFLGHEGSNAARLALEGWRQLARRGLDGRPL